jgi:hypothetical protein
MRLLPKSRWRSVGVSLAVVAAAGITLGVTTLLGVTFQGTGEAQDRDASHLKRGLLGTANRDRLAICVQAVGVDPSLEKKAKSSIEEALTEVVKYPRWEAAGLGAASPVVDSGCPSPPAVLRSDLKIDRLGRGLPVSTLPFPCVEEASYYAHFVFILSPAELERIFGEDPELTLADQETFCGGRSGNTGVTGGLYLTAADLDETELLTAKLKRAIGVWNPYESPGAD